MNHKHVATGRRKATAAVLAALGLLCAGTAGIAYTGSVLPSANAEHKQFTDVTSSDFPTEYGIVFKRIVQNSTSASYQPGDYVFMSDSGTLATDNFVQLHIEKNNYAYILKLTNVNGNAFSFAQGTQNIGSGADPYHFSQCGGTLVAPANGQGPWLWSCGGGAYTNVPLYVYASEMHTFSSDDVTISLANGKSWRMDNLTNADIAKIEIKLDDGTTYPVPQDCFKLQKVGEDWVVCIDSDVDIDTKYNGQAVKTSNVHATFGSYPVTSEISGGSYSGNGVQFESKEYVDKRSSYSGSIKADSLNYLPDTLDSVTVSGKELDKSKYTYDPKTGQIDIDPAAVLGPINIKATCPLKATLSTTIARDLPGTNVSERVGYTAEVTQATQTVAKAENVQITLSCPTLPSAEGTKVENVRVTDPSGTDVTDQCTVSEASSGTGINVQTRTSLGYNEKLTVKFDVLYGKTTSRPLLEKDYTFEATATAADSGKFRSTDTSSNDEGVHVYKPVLTVSDTQRNATAGTDTADKTAGGKADGNVSEGNENASDTDSNASTNTNTNENENENAKADASAKTAAVLDATPTDEEADGSTDNENDPTENENENENGAADAETDGALKADSGDRISHRSVITQTDANGKAFNPSMTLSVDAEAAKAGAYVDATTVKVTDANGKPVTASVKADGADLSKEDVSDMDDNGNANANDVPDADSDANVLGNVSALVMGILTANDAKASETKPETDASNANDNDNDNDNDTVSTDDGTDGISTPSDVTVTTTETMEKDATLVVTYDVVLGDDSNLDLRDTKVTTTVAAVADNADEVTDQNVTQVMRPVLSIKKTADTDKVLEGEGYTTRLDIAQTAKDAHAKHVAVRDSLQGEASKTGTIDVSSIKFELNGKEVTDEFKVDDKDGAGKAFDATSDLTLTDADALVVTYKVTAKATDGDALVSDDISNTAYVRASNAEETNAENKVDVYRNPLPPALPQTGDAMAEAMVGGLAVSLVASAAVATVRRRR